MADTAMNIRIQTEPTGTDWHTLPGSGKVGTFVCMFLTPVQGILDDIGMVTAT